MLPKSTALGRGGTGKQIIAVASSVKTYPVFIEAAVLFYGRYMDNETTQGELLTKKVEFIKVDSVIGSGYENMVADLAIRDKVAYRAARKNMQIHSAIILKIDGVFSGFMTFQVNHEVGEFCLLLPPLLPGRGIP